MIIFVIIFIIAFILAGTICFVYKTKNNKSLADKTEEFNKRKAEVVELINQDRKRFEEHEGEKISQVIQLKEKELNEKTKFFEGQEQALLEKYEEKKVIINEKIESLQNKLEEAISRQARIEAEQLQQTRDFYTIERANLDIDFINFKNEIENKITALKTELKKEETRQQEIIEEYKRAEKIKQNKNFYRINLSKNEQQDVKKLRNIAGELLHDPSVLYKLIYKNYYERPFNEMVGRVVTGRGSIGIYKITNLENGRVYIGQTRQTFKERWRTHLKRGVKAEPGTQNKLYNAMWEDGIENFTFEVLSECSAEELSQKEKEYIALYHADTWGYNSTAGNS